MLKASATEGGSMAIVRYDPMRMMLRFPNIWDDDFSSTPASDNLDLYETSDEVVAKAAVPGVDSSKVDITFEKGVMTISAAEEEEKAEGKKFYQKSSRAYAYRVAIPGNLDLSAEPTATFKNGVVTVTFKKAEEAKPKKITIKE
jgi:HSP20 family protein